MNYIIIHNKHKDIIKKNRFILDEHRLNQILSVFTSNGNDCDLTVQEMMRVLANKMNFFELSEFSKKRIILVLAFRLLSQEFEMSLDKVENWEYIEIRDKKLEKFRCKALLNEKDARDFNDRYEFIAYYNETEECFVLSFSMKFCNIILIPQSTKISKNIGNQKKFRRNN